MAQFQATNIKIEVNGQTVLSVANGLGGLKSFGLKILEENGIKNPKETEWYPQQFWLNAFKQISDKVGANTLALIGKSIPENALFPPEINSIHKALAAIDIAFHMNHRILGTVMFNPSTGLMQEGIGHYKYNKTSENSAEIVCDNSYPCDFDKAIVEAMANKFKPVGAKVKIEHDENKGCRKKGGTICIYKVSW